MSETVVGSRAKKRSAPLTISAQEHRLSTTQQKQQSSLVNFISTGKLFSTSEHVSESSKGSPVNRFRIFCDLDGVLVDFDAGEMCRVTTIVLSPDYYVKFDYIL